VTQLGASRAANGHDLGAASSALSASSVTFPEGQIARVVATPPWGDEAEIVRGLSLEKGRPVILLIGGADSFDQEIPHESELRNRLLQLFGRGLLRTADAAGAIVIDGGTDAGIIAILGAAARNQPRPLDLLGVAPAGKVSSPDGPAAGVNGRTPLEPNHTHFVLVDSAAWGGETSTLIDMAQVMADTRPVVVVVIHGGEVTKDELVRGVRRHWPVIVVAGFGGVADEVARFRDKPTEFVHDSRIAEVVADGRLLTFRATDAPAAFSGMLSLQLGGSDTLQRAVDLRNRYAHNARSRRDGFYRLQWVILALGVGGTGLALVHEALGDPALAQNIANLFNISADQVHPWLPLQPPTGGSGEWTVDRGLLHHIVVLVPLVTSVLLSASIRFNAGAAWVALRSSSEAIKAEVFRYRARAGTYSDRETTATSRDSKLAGKLDSINRRLMQTQANLTALQDPDSLNSGRSARDATHATKENDDLGFLTPDGYVRNRLEEQHDYYQGKAKELDKTLFHYQALIWGAGLVGSFLAAIGYELWIALTTGLAAAFGAYLKYRNVDRTLTGYNQAAAELDNVILWWSSLSTGERADQVNIDRLVDSTENVLAAENSAWLQQMENVLEGLRERQRKDSGGDVQNGEPASPPQSDQMRPVIAVAPLADGPPKPAGDAAAGTPRP
jgi:hypothetical protein